jgi:Fe-S-cluster-containing dehydrogenase component
MMNRRSFLKTLGVATGPTLIPSVTQATSPAGADPASPGVLVDITRCIGCRSCEVACGEENDRLVPDTSDRTIFEQPRPTSPEQWTVVNRYQTDRGEFYVKRQCMHCDQPACSTACLTKAMYKTPEGPIIWRASKCMGCRYCMISCPFDVPKFEYFSANPRIHKCTMCWDRQVAGESPACVAACPTEALQFGKRSELIELARARIVTHPEKYVHHIYGEHEVGGTSWLYLSPVPFEQVGFRTDLGTTPCPEYTKDFLYAVPIVILLWPTFLFGVSRATSGENRAEEAEQQARSGDSR